MILYVAGPMTDVKDLNFPLFYRVSARLTEAGYHVLNPAAIDAQFPVRHEDSCMSLKEVEFMAPDCSCGAVAARTWQWYMRKAVAMVAEADGIALLPLWQRSTGARGEVDVARLLGLPVKDYHDWLWMAKRARARQEADC